MASSPEGWHLLSLGLLLLGTAVLHHLPGWRQCFSCPGGHVELPLVQHLLEG